MTFLIATIMSPNSDEARAAIKYAFNAGADLVELRLDALAQPEEQLPAILPDLPRGKWIATCRSPAEGGCLPIPPAVVVTLLAAAHRAGAGWLDVERRLLAEDPELAASLGRECEGAHWIESEHFTEPGGPPDDRQVHQVPGGAIDKLAWHCHDISDNVSALKTVREEPERRIRVCMGPRGVVSRILARKFAAFGSFAALSDTMTGAPGQLSLVSMRDSFGWDRIDRETRVFGVLGWPVSHSLSPALFNWYFARDGVNAVYLPMPAETDAECVGFVRRCREAEWLGVGGFSVTIPHKQGVYRAFADGADEDVRSIGATNTVTLSDGGVSLANTDVRAVRGVVGTLAASGCLAESRALVLGAGGVAHAVVAALQDSGLDVTVTNRTAERSRILAGRFGCNTQAWDDRGTGAWDLVVNCTALGMEPAIEGTPLPKSRLSPGTVVFDTVYNPVRTRLLRDAADVGCQVVDGVEMFVRQASEQYQLWTGRAMDRTAASVVVRDLLDKRRMKSGRPES